MKKWRLFVELDFAKQEAYLRQMHQAGWALTEVTGLSYDFEPVSPQDMIYKVDIAPWDPDEWENYLAIFEEAGWEYVTQRKNNQCFFVYFLKPVKSFDENEPWDIYSDREVRLTMIKKKFRILLPGIAVCLFMYVLTAYKLATPQFYEEFQMKLYHLSFGNILAVIVNIGYLLIFFWLIFAFFYIIGNYYYLRKKYGDS